MRFLHQNHFSMKSSAKKIVHSEIHKQIRLSFCREFINYDFDKIIFSDEKKFCLNGPDRYQKYWGHSSDALKLINRNKFDGGSIMVHVAVCKDRVLSMVEILGNMDSKYYCHMLETQVFPLINNFNDKSSWVWQHDNAPIHNSSYTKTFFRNKSINLLSWPSRSPDLNIVENIFSFLEHKIYYEGQKYSSKDQLWSALDKAFTEIDKPYLKKLYESIKRRMLDICILGGALSKH